jgi:hypothetical protein
MSFSDWGINVAGVQGQPSGIPGLPGTGYFATSGTVFAIGTGPHSFVTETNLAYVAGLRVRAASQSNPTQWMEGVCTAYVGNVITLNVDLTSASAIVPAAVALPGYIGGLTLARDLDASNTRLDIAAGGATSDDNTTTMILPGPGPYIKNVAAAWAVGSGVGVGALAPGETFPPAGGTFGGTYHVFLIQRPDTGVVDVLVSALLNPTLPTSYSKQRRIGSIMILSSIIKPFLQLGDEFLWQQHPSAWDVPAFTVTTSVQLITLAVPGGIRVRAIMNLVNNLAGAILSIDCPDQTTPGVSVWNVGPGPQFGVQLHIRTNTAAQVAVVANAPVASTLFVSAEGWLDNRGR